MPQIESKFGAVDDYAPAGQNGRRVVLEQRSAQSSAMPMTRQSAEALAADLRARVRGEVRFDAGNRALYATDGSIYRQVPVGVVIPRDVEDVVAAVAVCREHGAPILPRGCGTSLEGQCCNAAVVLDFSKYLHHVLEVNPSEWRARVEPGVINDVLRQAAEQHHLTFAPDPATHTHCTVGGMIGNGSCGVHSVMGGKTEDNILDLDILLYDGTRMTVGPTSDDELEHIIREGGRRGEIYASLKALRDRYADLIRARFPNIPRRVSGYNLNELLPENGFNVARALVGAEGTCVNVLRATTRLVYSPSVRPLVVLGYPDPYTMADHVPQILEFKPIGLEGFDASLVEGMKKKQLHAENLNLLPEGGGWLLVEFGADTKEDGDEQARRFIKAIQRQPNAPHIKLFDDPEQIHKVWQVRESAVGAVSAVPGEPLVWPVWEDAAAPPDKLGGYLRDTRKLLDRYGYQATFFGHFGQGCVHMRMDFGLKTAHEVSTFREFMYDAARLVVSYGGSLSGEHGDGQAHAELLPIMFGPELVEAFREFKRIWDPTNKMNPGKLVDAYRMDQNLRLGIAYDPPQVKTHFQFPYDHFSFSRATERCVGVGKCRRIEEGTMCPSFMATREEMHSTRGRARLLFEMLQGDPIKGWKNESVKEALDLCLSCKGCKGECPVRVDMASYKAEFLSHYFEGRLRPPSAYAMGLIYWWARLASHAPRLANQLTQTPALAAVAKRLGGIAPQRQMPAFATQTFKQWFSARPPRNQGQPQVLLWADTFNNHFHPATATAAVEVLEAAGYQVVVPDGANPQQTLCCGRPLYDYGMLTLAKWHLRQILTRLEPAIQRGLPLVVLEPSCCSVFRDELLNLFPNDEDANRLARQTFTLGEFLQWHAKGYQPPMLRRKAVVHGHCHHKSVLGMAPDMKLLDALGLDYNVLDSGCCGMAGSFGFEAGERYEVSQKCGERVLLPAVRQAADDTLIIADGFSCREQIAQGTERQALHLAQVLQLALRGGVRPAARHTPEAESAALSGEGDHHQRATGLPRGAATTTILAGAGLALLGGALIWRWRERTGR